MVDLQEILGRGESRIDNLLKNSGFTSMTEDILRRGESRIDDPAPGAAGGRGRDPEVERRSTAFMAT